MTWADEHVHAILQAWYPGAQGGRAVAGALFGDFSPAGRLPVTFYRTTEELPPFKDYSMKNRTYRYMKNEALYPFGYGLSYTKFEYKDICLNKTLINAGESAKVSVKVKNCGQRRSDEVAQLYLKSAEAGDEAPKWQLRGFKRITLNPGEEALVEFHLLPWHMAMVDDCGRSVVKLGKYEVYVGGSQPDSRSIELTQTPVLKAEFCVQGAEIEIED